MKFILHNKNFSSFKPPKQATNFLMPYICNPQLPPKHSSCAKVYNFKNFRGTENNFGSSRHFIKCLHATEDQLFTLTAFVDAIEM